MDLNQNAIITLIVIEAVGVLITAGFGIAALLAYKKAKAAAETARSKASAFVTETEEFLLRLKKIAEA